MTIMVTCDRCLKGEIYGPFPFRFKMEGDPRADPHGWVQYFGCHDCLWEEHYRINRVRIQKWGEKSFLVPPTDIETKLEIVYILTIMPARIGRF